MVIELQKQTSPPLTMSYEEYLAWTGAGNQLTEWAEGEVITLMPPKNQHQSVLVFLTKLLGLFIEIFDLGQLQVAPFELKIRPDGPSREPDLMFVAKAHLDRLNEERVVGPPDLIIEIVSNDSVHRDRVDKFDEYEAGGVTEYWLIDNRPGRQRAQFYRLNPGEQYQPVPLVDGLYRSLVLPSFWLRPEWLWSEQPNALRALAEIVGPEPMAQALRQILENDNMFEERSA